MALTSPTGPLVWVASSTGARTLGYARPGGPAGASILVCSPRIAAAGFQRQGFLAAWERLLPLHQAPRSAWAIRSPSPWVSNLAHSQVSPAASAAAADRVRSMRSPTSRIPWASLLRDL